MSAEVTRDPWERLGAFTTARIALGRVGVSLPTAEVLGFRLAHARAQDAVMRELDAEAMARRLSGFGLGAIVLDSEAETKEIYLKRPDLGRRLSAASAARLAAAETRGGTGRGADVAIVVADGLSCAAAERNAEPFLAAFLPLVADLSIAPLCVLRHGRVAAGDRIGAILDARLVLMVIGERPGLSSPDGLGLYLTADPREGLTDERRNCVSNVRPEGFPPEKAAVKAEYLVRRSLAEGLTGVGLKDEQDEFYLPLLRRKNLAENGERGEAR